MAPVAVPEPLSEMALAEDDDMVEALSSD